jgi:hypothetical protein
VNFVCRRGAEGRPAIVSQPIPEMRPELRKIIEENA